MDMVGFQKIGKEYIIKVNKKTKLSAPWGIVLANKKFGTVITSNMGGYTFSKNSRLNRITSWINKPENDIPSEIIYMKDLDYGKAWSLNKEPMPDEEDYYIIYGQGYSKFFHASLGIIQELDTFVPVDDSIKLNILRLKNTTSEKRNLKLIYYIKPVLGEDEIKSDGYIDLEFKGNALFAKNIYGDGLSKNVFVISSEKIKTYTGNKREIIGNRSIEDPETLHKIELSNENALGHESCIACELRVSLEPYEDKKIILGLGEEETEGKVEDLIKKYNQLENVAEEYKKTKEYWNSIIRKVQVKTPVESLDIMLNGWTIYQTIACRMFAKTGYYQSGGATGFRDQLQDALSTKFINSDILKEQIIKHSKHQFEEGDVEHWWHDETKKGIRTKFSDDLLWLVYAVCEYIEFTGDMKILDEETAYLKGAMLLANEDERYDMYDESDKKGSIYDHCIRAIEKSIDFGDNGLPKIGSGDWNDGFSTVGNKGKRRKHMAWIFSIQCYRKI